MKAFIITTKPGKVITDRTGKFRARPGIREATESELAAIQSGDTYWTPDGEGGGSLSAPPARVPKEIPAWKGRTILRLTPYGEGTLWDAVQAAIASLPDQQRVAAEEVIAGTVFSRTSPTLAALSTGLGLTSEQVDALFIVAAGIQG